MDPRLYDISLIVALIILMLIEWYLRSTITRSFEHHDLKKYIIVTMRAL